MTANSSSATRIPPQHHFRRSAITFLMGWAIFVALPILSWGMFDILGFLEHPARLSFLLLVLLLNAYAAARIPEIGKTRPVEKTTVRRQHLAIVLLQVFSIAIVTVGPFCDRRDLAVMGDADVVRVAGLFLYILGFLMMHLAESRLGKQFTLEVAVHEDHRLVTDGLYRRIRHPRYLGIMIFSLGMSLVFRSWLGLVFTAATACTLLWRIRDEEKLMHLEFGAEWEEYTRGSWRLVPLVF